MIPWLTPPPFPQGQAGNSLTTELQSHPDRPSQLADVIIEFLTYTLPVCVYWSVLLMQRQQGQILLYGSQHTEMHLLFFFSLYSPNCITAHIVLCKNILTRKMRNRQKEIEIHYTGQKQSLYNELENHCTNYFVIVWAWTQMQTARMRSLKTNPRIQSNKQQGKYISRQHYNVIKSYGKLRL